MRTGGFGKGEQAGWVCVLTALTPNWGLGWGIAGLGGLSLAGPAVFEAILCVCLKETESEPEDNLDDLEKHLREKALRSMRKAQVSPPS